MAKKSKRRPMTLDHVRTLKALTRKKMRAARIAKTLKRRTSAAFDPQWLCPVFGHSLLAGRQSPRPERQNLSYCAS
jgi:hypothetical protein